MSKMSKWTNFRLRAHRATHAQSDLWDDLCSAKTHTPRPIPLSAQRASRAQARGLSSRKRLQNHTPVAYRGWVKDTHPIEPTHLRNCCHNSLRGVRNASRIARNAEHVARNAEHVARNALRTAQPAVSLSWAEGTDEMKGGPRG